jgi:hypothetical protein
MNQLRQHIRKTALFMMGVVCLWQVGALVHLSTVSHEVCVHGKIVDDQHGNSGAQHGKTSENSNAPGAPHGHPNHDNCRQLSSLTTANTSPHIGYILPTTVVSVSLQAIFTVVESTYHPRALYMIAPSQSPPKHA